MKRILVMEPNPFHGEVVPGIVYYLQQIDYKVTVLVRSQLIEEGIKVIMPPGCDVIEYADDTVGDLLCSSDVEEYDFLFLTSYEYGNNKTLVPFLEQFPNGIRTKFGVIGIYHSNYLINLFDDMKRMREGRVFCLSAFQRLSESMNMVVPQYFGTFQKINAPKDHIAIALVGNMYDPSVLSDAYYDLPSDYRKKIRFYHVGGTGKKEERFVTQFLKRMIIRFLALFHKAYKRKLFDKKIMHTGRLKFPEMLGLLTKMDYLMLPINVHSYEGIHYMSVSTSGSRQLAFGLGIPTIINTEVAKLYGFCETDSVLYRDGDMKTALMRAVDNTEYDTMCTCMKKKSEQISLASIESLKKVLASLVNENTVF